MVVKKNRGLILFTSMLQTERMGEIHAGRLSASSTLSSWFILLSKRIPQLCPCSIESNSASASEPTLSTPASKKHSKQYLQYFRQNVRHLTFWILRLQKKWHAQHDSMFGHIRYTNILTWPRSFRVKHDIFLSFFWLSIPKRDLDTKKTPPNIEVCPECLVAMFEC